MNVTDLLDMGFAQHGGSLHAPDGANVCFIPLDDARCFRLVIKLPNGGAVNAVIAKVALRTEAPR